MGKIPPMSASKKLDILKVILYILAAAILLVGFIAGISLISGAATMAANAVLPLQLMGGGEFSNLFGATISTVLVNVGVSVFLVSLVLSSLLYGLGRLFGRIEHLENRLAQLEDEA